MNKQELINDIEKNKNEFYKLCTDVKSTGTSRGIATGIYMGLLISQKKIGQLAEQPKVTVKKFVAEWFEEHKNSLNDSLWDLTIQTNENSQNKDKKLTAFEKWFIDFGYSYEYLIRMKNGYEVEKEPKFIVKVGNLYLIEPLGDTSDSTIRTTWNHKNAYEFTGYDMAQTHANKFGGEVEEVK